MPDESIRAAKASGYDVFLSYSHEADGDLAPAVQRGLARLAKPWNQPRALRVFRDDTDLSAAHALTDEIENALERSRYFLLLASPQAAASAWVDKEIRYWKQNKTPETFLIALTGGTVAWQGADFDWSVTTALPRSLSGCFAREPLWADLTFARDRDRRSLAHSGFRSAVASLAARPRGLPKEQLDSDDVRQHRITTRLRRAAVAGLVLLLIVAAVAGTGFLLQRDEARRQRDAAISRELISDSDKLASTDPSGARFDSLAAGRIDDTPESRYAVLAAAADRMIGRFSAHEGEVQDIAFSPDGTTLVTADGDSDLRLWAVATGRQIGIPFTGHTYTVMAVAFSGNGRMLASASDDRTVRVWNVETHTEIGDPIPTQPDSTGNAPPSVAFSTDDKTLAVTGMDGMLRLWDVTTHRQVGDPITGGSDGRGWIVSAAFSHDGKTVATAGSDHVARLWDVATHREIGRFDGHEEAVTSVRFSRDDKTLATSGVDGSARLWNVATCTEIGVPVIGPKDLAPKVAISPDGATMATGGFDRDNDVQVWDGATTQEIGTPFAGHTARIDALAFDPAGSLLASAGDDGYVIVWDLANRRPAGCVFPDPSGGVWALAFDPEGKTLATTDQTATVRFFAADTCREVGAPIPSRVAPVRSIAFSPDGKTLAMAGDSNEIRFADVAARREQDISIRTSSRHVQSIAYSPDGGTLASTDDGGTVDFWDIATRREKSTLPAGVVESLAFSPDGRTVATADNANRVRFWDVATHHENGAAIGYSGLVQSISFSPDGRFLATAGDGYSGRLWDVTTRGEIGTPLSRSESALMERIAFRPGGKSIAVSREWPAPDGDLLRLWDIGFLSDPAAYICASAGASFTPDEWARRVPPGPPLRKLCP
ncbi:TIR domain-containing protein [Nocardia terpenica]|uniref:TIR domain-containing protein n=1 Tax=Nocardia terpenica TaxID=455432 RepID=A0A6G9Z2S5_9NOCA|nr:TIR domain-containing protein [Nocardia terpenica]QIS19909.1 TIR domain-containing protein [Nocardia terpenica]